MSFWPAACTSPHCYSFYFSPQPRWPVLVRLPRPYLVELIHKGLHPACRGTRVASSAPLYRDLFGGYTSEQDDPDFFMSSNGKTDPQAELNATLKQFFSEELVGRSRQRLNAPLSPSITGCGNGCNSTIPVCRSWHANGLTGGSMTLRPNRSHFSPLPS